MICQRGSGAFIDGTRQMMHDCLSDGGFLQSLYCSASSHISERISVLTSLRYSLATLFAKVYIEVDRIGEDLVKDLENSLPSLLVAINDLFLKLEASIGHIHANRQTGSSMDGSYSVPLIFANLPEVNQDHSGLSILAIRDELFETFRKRQKGVMEREEVQLTADSLHRLAGPIPTSL